MENPRFGSEDEWELCNDEGFLYRRRRKRQRLAIRPEESAEEGLEEQGLRRRRRRRVLWKLREKYRSEIRRWEGLSERMEEMKFAQQRSPGSPVLQIMEICRGGDMPETGIAGLLSQAGAQEGIIDGILRLCDATEATCEQRMVKIKQSLIDLPIWRSPRALLASLSEFGN